MNNETVDISSSVHPHEPQINPQLDSEGRCLICTMMCDIGTLQSQLTSAQKACAKKDEALQSAYDFITDDSDICRCDQEAASDGRITCTHCNDSISTQNEIHHALSSNAGEGFVRREELQQWQDRCYGAETLNTKLKAIARAAKVYMLTPDSCMLSKNPKVIASNILHEALSTLAPDELEEKGPDAA